MRTFFTLCAVTTAVLAVALPEANPDPRILIDTPDTANLALPSGDVYVWFDLSPMTTQLDAAASSPAAIYAGAYVLDGMDAQATTGTGSAKPTKTASASK